MEVYSEIKALEVYEILFLPHFSLLEELLVTCLALTSLWQKSHQNPDLRSFHCYWSLKYPACLLGSENPTQDHLDFFHWELTFLSLPGPRHRGSACLCRWLCCWSRWPFHYPRSSRSSRSACRSLSLGAASDSSFSWRRSARTCWMLRWWSPSSPTRRRWWRPSSWPPGRGSWAWPGPGPGRGRSWGPGPGSWGWSLITPRQTGDQTSPGQHKRCLLHSQMKQS